MVIMGQVVLVHLGLTHEMKMDYTPEIRKIGLEQSVRVYGFDKTVLQIPSVVCIPERNIDVCGHKRLG